MEIFADIIYELFYLYYITTSQDERPMKITKKREELVPRNGQVIDDFK